MRLVFMGTPAAAVPTLERCIADGHEIVAVWTQPDRPAGRGNKLAPPPVKVRAEQHGLPVHQPEKIRHAAAKELFASYGADVAVVVAYGRILPPEFLAAPRFGCVNVHFSLLPKYRGAAPVNWAIVRGESETGVTTMFMDAGLDTGDILLQSATPIGPAETAPELLARLSITGAELLSRTLQQLGAIAPQPQDHAQATLAPVMQREDGLVDWHLTAEEIACRARGFQPWPNAFTTFRGAKLVIWRAVPAPETNAAAPGTVILAKGEKLRIACGGGTVLQVEETQPEGKRRLPVKDFLNGARLQTGEMMGA
jgi:methionyl-tRNA formyltransferase